MVVYEGVEINEVNLREYGKIIYFVFFVSKGVSKYYLYLVEI